MPKPALAITKPDSPLIYSFANSGACLRAGMYRSSANNITRRGIDIKKLVMTALSISFLASGAFAQVSNSNNYNGYGNTNPDTSSSSSNNSNGYGNTNPSATAPSSNNTNGYGNTNPSATNR